MNQLIQVINRLQDVWSCIGAPPIELPQLVVVGAQSSGKSSVLENIVGRDLLPRGGGIVTRRPLILQLVNTQQVESELYPPEDAAGDEAVGTGARGSGSRPNDTDTESNSGDHSADGAAGARRARDAKAADRGDGKGKDSKKDDTAAGASRANKHASGSANGQSDTKQPAGSAGSSALNSTQSSGAAGDTDSTAGDVEWGEFGHKKGQRFYDFEEIRDEITKETDRVVGSKKNISAQPIMLKVFSPHVLNLTLVDLPGITKVPVGDQPSDIEKQIRDMIWTYITSPAAIIVAVTPANMDLANSDSLKLAREADPQGLRTIGVLTKLDLMDKGTDALDVLTGKVISLQHGFVGVVNRSQLDINQRKSIRQSLAAERQFFMQHAVYRPIANRCGTAYLAKRLNAILMHHIQDSLPEMRVRIAHNIAETQEELESYGNPLLNSPSNLGSLLLHLLSKFCNNYCDALEGKSPDVSITQLYGGARISYIFHDVFCKRLDNINPFDELTDQDIRTAIRNATGPRPSLFIPEISFELLVKRQIERLQAPSLQCVDLVFDELKRVASQCESLVSELQRFPVLRENVYDCVRSLLERRLRPTKTMINNLVHVELAYINTNHPDFIGGSKAVSSLMDRMAAMSAQAKAGVGPGSSAAGAGSGAAAGGNNKPQSKESPVNKAKPVSPPMDGAAMPGPLRLIGRDDQKFGGRRPMPPTAAAADAGGALVPAGRNAFADDVAYDTKPAVGRGRLRDLHLEDPKPVPHAAGAGLHRPIQSIPTPLPTDRELIETEIIKSLISSYFNIVRKNIQDSVPKAIMYFLVNHSKQDIQSELVRTLYKEVQFEGLLKEADDVSQKRMQCVEHLRTMRKALDIVNSVRDYNPLSATV